MDIKSKLIKDTDIVVQKPSKLKAITSEIIHIDGFNTILSAIDIQEYFINDKKTLITCSVKQQDKVNVKEQIDDLFESLKIFFYRPKHLNYEENIDSMYKKLDLYLSKKYTIGKKCICISDENFEIIPMEEEVIFRFLVDNFELSKEIEFKN